MNKKIPIAIGIAVAVIGIIIVGAKAYLGDEKTELPAEEQMEKSLNIEEKSTAKVQSPEAGETRESEAAEAGEANERTP